MYKPSLDGIRALCIVFTICNHIDGAPGFVVGSVGVDVFFALSGFLITTLLIDEQRKTGQLDLRAFYIRRFFRIVPLYYLTIALYFLSSIAAARLGPGGKGFDAFSNSFIWLVLFNKEYQPAALPGVFGHAWTLGIEEKFYLIWPVFAHALLVRRSTWIWIAPVVTIAVLWALSGFGDEVLRGYAGLSFGAIVAVLVGRHPTVGGILARESCAALACLGLLAGYLVILRTSQVSGHLMVSLAGAVLVASLWLNDRHWISRLLSAGPLAWAGTLTYSIYLVHVLVANGVAVAMRKAGLSGSFVLSFVVVYLVSIAIAEVLHRTVEQPLIRVGRRLAARRRDIAPEDGGARTRLP